MNDLAYEGAADWTRALLDALPAAVYTTDADGRLTFFNRAAAELWGCRPTLGSDRWCGSWRLYWPDGRPMPHDQCPMAVALKEDRAVRGAEAVAERPDGTRVPFIPHPVPLHDSDGRLVGAVNMLVEVTERHRAEVRQKALVDELNHRVKNMLATVQALAAQTLSGADVPDGIAEAFQGRLFALSQGHDQLASEQWESADLGAIVDGILSAYCRAARDRIRIRGGAVRLAPRAALMLAMVLNELATNAARYGALSTPAGSLDLSWRLTAESGERRLCIVWAEWGGPPVEPARRHGFGTRLVERGVQQELKGTARLSFDPAGFRCSLEVPVSASGT